MGELQRFRDEGLGFLDSSMMSNFQPCINRFPVRIQTPGHCRICIGDTLPKTSWNPVEALPKTVDYKGAS